MTVRLCCVPEHSLSHSKHQQLRSVVTAARNDDDNDINVDDIIVRIAAVKKINVADCPQ